MIPYIIIGALMILASWIITANHGIILQVDLSVAAPWLFWIGAAIVIISVVLIFLVIVGVLALSTSNSYKRYRYRA